MVSARPAALVTGAASGIGAATAMRFAAAGYAVLLADLTAEVGEEVAQKIRGDGNEARFVRTDVAQAIEVQAAVEACVSEFGQIDSLVSCAGIEGAGQKLLDLNEEDFAR